MIVRLFTYPLLIIGAYMVCGPSVVAVAGLFLLIGLGYGFLKT
jgi:hypothetical protein